MPASRSMRRPKQPHDRRQSRAPGGWSPRRPCRRHLARRAAAPPRRACPRARARRFGSVLGCARPCSPLRAGPRSPAPRVQRARAAGRRRLRPTSRRRRRRSRRSRRWVLWRWVPWRWNLPTSGGRRLPDRTPHRGRRTPKAAVPRRVLRRARPGPWNRPPATTGRTRCRPTRARARATRAPCLLPRSTPARRRLLHRDGRARREPGPSEDRSSAASPGARSPPWRPYGHCSARRSHSDRTEGRWSSPRWRPRRRCRRRLGPQPRRPAERRRSGRVRTRARSAAPLRCPSPRDRPRPLPPRALAASDLEELVLFVTEQLVDGGHHVVGELVELTLHPLELVRGELAVALQSFEFVARRPPQVAHRHASFFRLVPHHLDELLAPLLGERRKAEADDGAVVGRRDTDVRGLDRLLDARQRRLVVRRDHEQARLGNAQAGDRPQLDLRAVDIHPEVLHDAGRRTPAAHAGEFGLRVGDGLVHPLSGVGEHYPRELVVCHRISVPISSPASARRRFPGPMRSNTSTGSRLSLQKVIAVRSITRRSWFTTSMKLSSSYRRAVVSSLGSAL